MNTLTRTYDLLKSGLVSQFGADSPIEPFTHVARVEELRHQYRPAGPIRLLLVAESHVRTAEADFATKGVQFLYEHRYYTPWWGDLLLPGFGASSDGTTAGVRQDYLERMQAAGFWLLDVSILALSGYEKVGASTSRPFEARREQLLRTSWSSHVRALFQHVLTQPTPPVIVAFDNVADVLPLPLRNRVPRLKFKNQKNTKQYRSPSYDGGTATFAAAARQAGLATCLRDLRPS